MMLTIPADPVVANPNLNGKYAVIGRATKG
jgi:hypothetical protein